MALDGRGTVGAGHAQERQVDFAVGTLVLHVNAGDDVTPAPVTTSHGGLFYGEADRRSVMPLAFWRWCHRGHAAAQVSAPMRREMELFFWHVFRRRFQPASRSTG